MRKLTNKTPFWTLRDVLASREAFETGGAFHGGPVGDSESYGLGRLPREYVTRLQANRPDYVIYSYSTPIAWHDADGWTVPHEHYSVTTSRHQGMASVAISQLAEVHETAA